MKNKKIKEKRREGKKRINLEKVLKNLWSQKPVLAIIRVG